MPLMDKIQHKTAVIGVVGLGYVGLPLAIAFTREGYDVEGYDTDVSKVVGLRRGYTSIGDVDSKELQTLLMKTKLNFTFKLPDKWRVDIVVICVPTPITEDKKPDLSYITDAVKQIKDKLASRDSIVILESSTYPGTTRDVVLPILAGSAKYVAYSPERVDPGSKKYNLRNTPKLVAGIDKESTELATLLYEQIVDKVAPVSSPEVAETAKLFENVFRNVNIALVNEMALICEKIGVSVWEVIDAAATKPFGFMPFYPGVGVGGHCFIDGTWVMTEHGPRKIEDIREGMLVLSGDGRLHKVLQKFQHHYSGEVITIKARGLPGTTMTPKHEIYTATDGRPPKLGRKHFPVHGKSTTSMLSAVNKAEARTVTESNYTIWPRIKAEAGPGSNRLLDRNDGYIYHRVKSATSSQYSGLVHNLWVDETNNYVVPAGVVANCIPVDPYYLADKADGCSIGYTKLIRTALAVNEEMPLHTARWIANVIAHKGESVLRTKILVLGVAFKRDVGDVRESPSVELLEILQSWRADAYYNDPYVSRLTNHKTLDLESVELTDELLESADCVVIATDHSCYDWKWIVDKAKLVFDTRNATKGMNRDNIYRLGERKAE